MLLKTLITLSLAVLFSLHTSAQVVLDTINTKNGAMVMFEDRTWQYLDDLEFDGILNQHLHGIITSIPDLDYIQTWDNDVCYTSDKQNDLSLLNDTLWICLLDDDESGFKMPFDGVVTSRYGYRSGRYHNGIDIDLDTGDTVKAAWSGKVRYSKFNEGGFGNLVIVRHNNGLESFYAHLSKLLVVPNQNVEAGTPLGLGGNTGHSRGSHLHFEVRFYDAPINPEEVIDFENNRCKSDNLFVHKSIFRPGAKPTDLEEHGESLVSAQNVVKSQSRKYHKIRRGDTLTRIAANNHTTVAQLCRLNGLRYNSKIQIGRTIRVR
jgi:LysM repeat protein|tara:strand:- start:15271 stop:16230 length:960 start_codon:yes stop_codon:yes gene_type:complete